MHGILIKKVTLIIGSISLIFIFILCSTEGNGNGTDGGDMMMWVVIWYSNEDLGGMAGSDDDIFVSRSTDNGATWTAVQTLNSNANTDSGDDYEACVSNDGNGNWVAVWQSRENLGGTAGTDCDIFVSHSTDNGVTWSAVQTLNSNANTDIGEDDEPCVVTDDDGNWIVVWASFDDLGGTVGTDYDIFVSRSTDNGATWSPVQIFNSNANTDSGEDLSPYLVTDGNGNWIAVWESTDDLGGTAGNDCDIFISRSIDNGATWTAVQTLNSNANTDSGNDFQPCVNTDGNGNWIVVWQSGEDLGGNAGTDRDIFVSRSTDNGATWTAVQILNSNATTDTEWDIRPHMITDGNGNWITVWDSTEDLGGTAGNDNDIFISRSADNGATWTAVQILNSNATTDTGWDLSPHVITDGNDNWITVWDSDENLDSAAGNDSDIFISRSTDNGATWSAVQILNSNAYTDSGDDSF